MKLKDALLKAITIINDSTLDLESASDKRIQLISSGQMIVNELITLYATPTKEEEVLFANGEAAFPTFSEKVKEVVAVREHGVSLTFSVTNTHVKADCNRYALVKYKYFPETGDLDGDLDLPPALTADTLALGICAEYFFRQGFSEEAAFYKNRYDIAVVNLIKGKSSFILKVKRMV